METIIAPPKIEQIFQWMIDGMGYHDSESIPVKDVFKMFEAFFHYEHRWNSQLQKLLDEYIAITPHPIIMPHNPIDESPEDAENPRKATVT